MLPSRSMRWTVSRYDEVCSGSKPRTVTTTSRSDFPRTFVLVAYEPVGLTAKKGSSSSPGASTRAPSMTRTTADQRCSMVLSGFSFCSRALRPSEQLEGSRVVPELSQVRQGSCQRRMSDEDHRELGTAHCDALATWIVDEGAISLRAYEAEKNVVPLAALRPVNSHGFDVLVLEQLLHEAHLWTGGATVEARVLGVGGLYSGAECWDGDRLLGILPSELVGLGTRCVSLCLVDHRRRVAALRPLSALDADETHRAYSFCDLLARCRCQTAIVEALGHNGGEPRRHADHACRVGAVEDDWQHVTISECASLVTDHGGGSPRELAEMHVAKRRADRS
eukprot:scaffold95346_cov66-Phaeocystis_antarctica.AAC.5